MNKIKMNDIAFLKMGQSPQGAFCNNLGDGTPLLNGPSEFNEFYPLPVQYTTDVKRLCKKGEILFCVRGSTTGRMNWADREYALGRGLASISHKFGEEYNHFLMYLIQSNLDSILKITSGSTFPNLTGDMLNSFEFVVPDKNTQKQISKFLLFLDSKIALNNRINTELEAMAKTMYDYWFVQFDFPNSEGKPYKSSGGKMVWSEELNREVPEGWEVGIIGDYCPSTGGFAFKSEWWTNEGVSVVKIKDIQENYTIDLNDLAKVDLIDKKVDDKFKAKAGDILIAMTGATVGKYAIVPKTEYSIYVNQRVGFFNLGLEPTKKLPYLINSLNQSYFREAIFTLASGAAQPNISNEQINNIQLIKPRNEIVNQYNSQLESAYQKILNNQQENLNLSSLRDWLLPMLMNGQVKVNSGYEGEAAHWMATEPEEKY